MCIVEKWRHGWECRMTKKKKQPPLTSMTRFIPHTFLTTIWNSKCFFCWAHKNCLEIMSFNVGFPDLPPLVYLRKCVFSFSSGTFGAAAIAADATNTKHKLCLFHIVSIWYTWMCFLPTQKFVFDKAYYLKHSSELHTLEYDTCILERIDCELTIKRSINNMARAVKCRIWTNVRQTKEQTDGRKNENEVCKNPNESTIYSRILKKNNKWQKKHIHETHKHIHISSESKSKSEEHILWFM